MLCTSCQNKPNCLAAQLAQGDAALDQLLGQLKRCGLRPHRSLWQRLETFWRSSWERLRLWLTP
jgi:hypothetical protein